MEQQIGTTVQKMIDKPTDAWMATLPIVFIALIVLFIWLYRQDRAQHQGFMDKVMQANGEREQRYIGLIEGPIKEMSSALTTLSGDIRDVKEEIAEMKGGQ